MKKLILLVVLFFGINTTYGEYQELVIGCNTKACFSEVVFDEPQDIINLDIKSISIRGDLEGGDEGVNLIVFGNTYPGLKLIKDSSIFNEIFTNIYIGGIWDTLSFSGLGLEKTDSAIAGMSNYWEAKVVFTYDLFEDPVSGTGTIINVDLEGLTQDSANIGTDAVKIIGVQNGDMYLYRDEIVKLIIDFILMSMYLFLLWKIIMFVKFLVYG